MADFKTGDKVEIHTHDIYLGRGIVTSLNKRGNAKLFNVETFDGCHYAVSASELTQIKE